MRAAELHHGVDRDRDREAPPEGDDDPTCVLRLRFVEEYSRDNPVSEEYQDRGTDHLCSEDAHEHPFVVKKPCVVCPFSRRTVNP